MFRAIHGEGHPALWYLVLRAGDALIGAAALPVIAAAVAAAATALFVARAPFAWPVKALVLASRFVLFEYAVMARNYGISMLLMFAFAALYRRWRSHGPGLGILLLLLANTNVHSALIAGALFGYWTLDLVRDGGWRQPGVRRLLAVNALLVVLGIVACALTVYPPANDAAVRGTTVTAARVLAAILDPGAAFYRLGNGTPGILLTALLIATLGGLARKPAALLAALGALIGMSLLFNFVYRGDYRHDALWLVLVLTLYWLVHDGRPRDGSVAMQLGSMALIVLLLIQVVLGARIALAAAATPFSRSRDFAAWLAARPPLRDAILVAEPDYMIESLPYYTTHPTYLVREQRFGSVTRFTREARVDLTLDQLIGTVCALRRRSGREVLLLIAADLGPERPPQTMRDGIGWTFATAPSAVRRLDAAAERLIRFGPALSRERYTVYRVRPGCAV